MFLRSTLLLLSIFALAGFAQAQSTENQTAATTAAAAPTTAAVSSSPAKAGDFTSYFGKKFMRGPGGAKKIALTFDDGPHPRTTPQAIQALKEANAKATFFMLGNMIASNPDLAKQVADAGFEIGCHSYSHADLRRKGIDDIKQEVLGTNEQITQITGQPVRLFRPPYGNIGDGLRKVTADNGLVMVLWSIDPRDWSAGMKADAIAQRVINGAHPGAIVCMHDIKPQTVAALPQIIKGLREKGYELVTVSELLNDAVAHPELMHPGAADAGEGGEAGAGYGAPEAAAQPLAIPLDLTTRK